MYRRQFLKGGFVSLASLALPNLILGLPIKSTGEKFKLKFAPHFGLFENLAGKDITGQLSFIYDQGFTALEDNTFPKRPRREQTKIISKMQSLKLEMGVFVANLSTAFGKDWLSQANKKYEKAFLNEIKQACELAQQVKAKWATVVLGELSPKLELAYQTAYVVEILRKASQICKKTGLIMVLEPLNPYVDHPNMFLAKTSHAYEICRAVDSPYCKILFDVYHQQIAEGNLIHNINLAWDEIAYFQLGDTPGRKEPGSGEINYVNVLAHVHQKGFRGIYGMEHHFAKKDKAEEIKILKAYRHLENLVLQKSV